MLTSSTVNNVQFRKMHSNAESRALTRTAIENLSPTSPKEEENEDNKEDDSSCQGYWPNSEKPK